MTQLRPWSLPGRALAFVLKTGAGTPGSVAEALGIPSSSASDALLRCQETGHLTRVTLAGAIVYLPPFPPMPAIADRSRPLRASLGVPTGVLA